MEDITEKFDDGSLERWREAMIKLIGAVNMLTGKKWMYLEVVYDEAGNVSGCKLYGNGSEDVDAVRH